VLNRGGWRQFGLLRETATDGIGKKHEKPIGHIRVGLGRERHLVTGTTNRFAARRAEVGCIDAGCALIWTADYDRQVHAHLIEMTNLT